MSQQRKSLVGTTTLQTDLKNIVDNGRNPLFENFRFLNDRELGIPISLLKSEDINFRNLDTAQVLGLLEKSFPLHSPLGNH